MLDRDLSRILVISAVLYLFLGSIIPVSAATCYNNRCGCDLEIQDIWVEKLYDLDNDDIYPWSMVRVRTRVSIDGNGADVEMRLFVDGEFFDNELTHIGEGVTKNIVFDRILYLEDYDCENGDTFIKVIAEACCDEDIESMYLETDYCCDGADCCGGSDCCDWNDCCTDCCDRDCCGGDYCDYDCCKSDCWRDCGWRCRGDWCDRDGADSCDPEYTSAYRCFGSYVQRKYINSDCEEEWHMVKYCTGTCSMGSCIGRSIDTDTTTSTSTSSSTSTTTTTTPTTTTSTQPSGILRPLVSLKGRYPIKTCEVSTFDFEIMNLARKTSNYELEVTGEAADLIYVPKSVEIEAGKTKAITAYAYQCASEVPGGDFDFTITARGEEGTSAVNSVLSVDGGFILFRDVEDGESIYNLPENAETLLFWLLIIIIIIVVIYIIWLILKALAGARLPRMRRARKSSDEPEQFRKKKHSGC